MLTMMKIALIGTCLCGAAGLAIAKTSPAVMTPVQITQSVNPYTITPEKAKEIAVSDADLEMNDVRFIKVEEEFDDGINKVKVEFVHGNTEYEYEINASNGDVLDSSIDDHFFI